MCYSPSNALLSLHSVFAVSSTLLLSPTLVDLEAHPSLTYLPSHFVLLCNPYAFIGMFYEYVLMGI